MENKNMELGIVVEKKYLALKEKWKLGVSDCIKFKDNEGANIELEIGDQNMNRGKKFFLRKFVEPYKIIQMHIDREDDIGYLDGSKDKKLSDEQIALILSKMTTRLDEYDLITESENKSKSISNDTLDF